jgi:PAS domain S-box-containing protein
LILIPAAKLILVFIKNIRDEKERLQYSETYISNIFNNTFDAMFIIDRIGTIKKVNLSSQKLFAYDESELLGNNINMLIPEPNHSKHDSYLKAYKDDGHSIVIGEERELYALDKLGNLIPISLSVTKMELVGEIFFIGSIKDYTQLKSAQKKQREQEMMLLQQSKFAAMGEMLSAIAHQWRQPLNSIGLIIQDLVSAQKHGEFTTAYLQESRDGIMNQLQLMSDTIDEFRNFFLQTNVKKRFNVINAIEEVRHLYWAQFNANYIVFELLCKDKNNEFSTCIAGSENGDERYMIESLPNELKQVLLNIIANAKDVIEQITNPVAHQRTISVYLSQTEEAVLIEICDNAGGIDDNLLKRIFEPYFTTKAMGTGLGLFIVKTLLEKHLHGTISCKNYKSELNGVLYQGSSFSLTLPKCIDVC